MNPAVQIGREYARQRHPDAQRRLDAQGRVDVPGPRLGSVPAAQAAPAPVPVTPPPPAAHGGVIKFQTPEVVFGPESTDESGFAARPVGPPPPLTGERTSSNRRRSCWGPNRWPRSVLPPARSATSGRSWSPTRA